MIHYYSCFDIHVDANKSIIPQCVYYLHETRGEKFIENSFKEEFHRVYPSAIIFVSIYKEMISMFASRDLIYNDCALEKKFFSLFAKMQEK